MGLSVVTSLRCEMKKRRDISLPTAANEIVAMRLQSSEMAGRNLMAMSFAQSLQGAGYPSSKQRYLYNNV